MKRSLEAEVDPDICSIAFLDGSGHLALTWDPRIPESVERARADFLELQKQGYEFFLVISREPAPDFDPWTGALEVVRRLDASEVEPRLGQESPSVELKPTTEQAAVPPVRTRRGGRTSRERVVAGRPMAGG